jgi:arylsulfatase A-like enzyme
VEPEPVVTLQGPDIHQRFGDRPNVLLIVTDDLGYGDLASYGAPDIRTPHIDRLAREGVRLTEAYANGAVCTPTRAALMTGRYQQRIGLEDVLSIAPVHHHKGLVATGDTLPALLKKNGYATALYGKWHLGYAPEFSPNAHGFDDFFGVLSGAVDHYTHQRADGEPDLFENGRPVATTEYLTDAITRRGVQFLEQQADRPFFLELAYTAPHWPFQPPDRPVSRRPGQQVRLRQLPSDDAAPSRGDYASMVERVDDGVGQILAALDRLQLASNTLVIFTSDNGGEWLSRNLPFFHRKGTLWEGGIRVPMLLRWPGRLRAGHVSTQVAITMDLTATILAATQSVAPAGHQLDGIDLVPHLRDAQPVLQRRLFWRRLPFPDGQAAVRDGRWKLLLDGPHALLFDLETDFGERHDLAWQHPEIVRRMSEALEEWFDQMNAAMKPFR